MKAEFRIPSNVVKAIQDGFGFKLTAQEVARLEIAARQTIDLRRFALQRPARDDFRRELAVTKRRREKIVKVVDQLRCLLDDDERAEPFWRLSLSNSVQISPRGTMLRLEDAAPYLEYLKWLAQLPHAVVAAAALWERPRRSGEQRKRKNADNEGWDFLIGAALLIFQKRGLRPTANYVRKTRDYNSPLLRGLMKLHDVLPTDVQASSASALGSPTAERIKHFNKSKKAKGRK